MKVKLNRAQELVLIQIGLETLLQRNPVSNETTMKQPRKYKKRARTWTPERRAKFSATMQKKWASRKHAHSN